MKKLIELLNEYRTEKGERNLNEFEVSQTLDSLNYLRLFIKWLVYNDKIERTYRKDLKYPYYIDDKERDLKGYEKSDLLVMLCSIQDNPIEFLISILK